MENKRLIRAVLVGLFISILICLSPWGKQTATDDALVERRSLWTVSILLLSGSIAFLFIGNKEDNQSQVERRLKGEVSSESVAKRHRLVRRTGVGMLVAGLLLGLYLLYTAS
jgi:hypothetical protein